jgi:hypothetical protein
VASIENSTSAAPSACVTVDSAIDASVKLFAHVLFVKADVTLYTGEFFHRTLLHKCSAGGTVPSGSGSGSGATTGGGGTAIGGGGGAGGGGATGGSLPAGEFYVQNASGGIYWRSAPDWNAAEATAGNGFYPGTVIKVSCYQTGAANVPGSSDNMWEQASWVSGPGRGSGWINEHFIGDGSAINRPSAGAAPCSPPPPPAQTWGETAGGVAHTWTNYTNAGGTQGPSIAGGQTVQIACRLPGFQVADGNRWWYRIASAPWSGSYYVSADAFYNNGQTSGSLHGTPFVDPAVANC